MKNKFTNLLHVILLMVLLAGCAPAGPEIADGQVLATFQGTTKYIIENFVNNGSAFINPDSNVVVFARPLAGNVAWVAVENGKPYDGLTGNIGTFSTWKEYVKALGENGYRIVLGTGAAYYEMVLKAAAGLALMNVIEFTMLVPVGELNFAEDYFFHTDAE